MSWISRLLLLSLIASALVVPGHSEAQSVCEGLSTVLKAMRHDREELEYYTLPGATCERDNFSYHCDWSMPRRDSRTFTRRSEFDEWHRNAENELKKLAGAIRRCIHEKKIRYEWHYIERERDKGWITKYYVYTVPSVRPKFSIALCTFYGPGLTEGWLRLRVRMGRHTDAYRYS